MPLQLVFASKGFVIDGDGGVYQRIVTLTFKEELSKDAITDYLQPVIKEQGEA